VSKFIAYFRVSTERQGRSGLGLAAQHRKITEFVAGAGTLIAEFSDVQSGRDDSRVELQRAIQLAKRENAKIVIARLDRFSRRVSFIASILEQGIGLVCAEMPNATDFQLHIFAALAQEERRLISERTKAALAEAKRRGKILGSNGRNLAAKNREAANEFACHLRMKLDADVLRRSYSEIARHLNEAGVTTITGRKFYPQTVKNYLSR
jgi:DNA invertase Pin-like site-specific DNA recombinase